MQKKFILFLLSGIFFCVTAFAQYTVQSIPNPKRLGPSHFVSDPDGNLRSDTLAQLNAISANIEKQNSSEFAIVVVSDYQGSSDFSFALDLFTHWGIGKRGSDNGLLLFLAMDRREYRFISGYGVEGIFPDALLKQIGESYLVPYLKAGNTDMAVLASARAIESVFLSPGNKLELAGLQAYQPTFWNRYARTWEQTLWVMAGFTVGFAWLSWARERAKKKYAASKTRFKGAAVWYAFFTFLFVLFASSFIFVFMEKVDAVYRLINLPYFIAVFGALVLLFHYYESVRFLRRSTADPKTGLDMQVSFARTSLLPLLLSPFAYKAFYDLVKNAKHARLRNTPPDGGPWTRLNRDTVQARVLNKYLGKRRLKEEKIGAKSYEVWLDSESGQVRLIDFAGDHAGEYSPCPECGGQTLKAPATIVLKRATYTKTGKGERIQRCAFCNYQKSLGLIVLPVRERSSGSSSSSGSSGSSSGSSSSGGSFGGGSSGGGGAGGRW